MEERARRAVKEQDAGQTRSEMEKQAMQECEQEEHEREERIWEKRWGFRGKKLFADLWERTFN